VDGVPVPGLLCERNAVIHQDGADLLGHGFEPVLKKLPGSLSISVGNELSDGELERPVDYRKEKERALGTLHFGYVDMV
jgi:hypothetical protein